LLNRGNGCPLPQMSLAFFSFAGKQMALKPLVSFHLAASGHSKPFGGCPVGFDFRHFSPCSYSFIES
jgi:hypothetical protein